MAEAVVVAVGILVFAALWASGQDWFDFLPRRGKRTFRTACLVLFVLSVLLVPTEFQSGLQRFIERRVAWAQEKTSELTRGFLDRLGSAPTPAPSPS